MHCLNAPCIVICPVDCFYTTEDGVVLHDRTSTSAVATASISVLSASPSSPGMVPSVPAARWINAPSACADGPESDSFAEGQRKYVRNRLAEDKLQLGAEMCATKALLAGDADEVADAFRERVACQGAVTHHDLGLGRGLWQAERESRLLHSFHLWGVNEQNEWVLKKQVRRIACCA